MKKWYLVLFTDKERTDLYKVLECYTIKQVAYLLDMKPQEVSNYFHKLINPRGNLEYCLLYQNEV
jgi:hypothetical protein|tara:strand:- start:6664 stop:6858 length:195 start_codon:yes stop_codon:yes gene_type:complete